MNYPVLAVVVILAVLDWVAVWKKSKTWEYVFKPATLLALVIWFWLATDFQGQALWIGLALIFGLAGDVFLMLPFDVFIAGLVAFMLGHISYIIGFNPTLPALTLTGVLIIIVIAAVAFLVGRKVFGGLAHHPDRAILRPGVAVYMLAISLMVVSAGLTLIRPEWSFSSAAMVAVGAALFFASDSYLALDRFAHPWDTSRIVVIVTYHFGQILLALGAAQHLLALAK
jgi:uncharacterized membrane protein YhhN